MSEEERLMQTYPLYKMWMEDDEPEERDPGEVADEEYERGRDDLG